jgi:branched-subunit amino acid ABC-type transport system permease component
MFILQILLNSLVIGTQVLLLSICLYLIYSVSKIYHLALGAIAIGVAYSVYLSITNGWPWLAVVFSGATAAMAFGFLSFFLLESSAKKQEGMFGLLISFAFGLAIESVMAIIFGTDGKFLFDDVLPVVSFGGLEITVPGIITIITGVFLAIVFSIIVHKTPWGRDLRGVAENSALISSLMINAQKMRLYAFLVASFLAGFIGTMKVLNSALTPQGGFNLIVLAFIALLVGGVNSIRGLIISSYVIVLIPELIISMSNGAWKITTSWQMFIVFIIAAVLLIWRPNGLLSKEGRLV